MNNVSSTLPVGIKDLENQIENRPATFMEKVQAFCDEIFQSPLFCTVGGLTACLAARYATKVLTEKYSGVKLPGDIPLETIGKACIEEGWNKFNAKLQKKEQIPNWAMQAVYAYNGQF